MNIPRAATLAVILALPACVSENNSGSQDAEWQVSCTQDAVTASRTCRAFTFGRAMDHTGTPYGSPSYPFQVFYVNGSGPYLLVGLHTFPGERPTVRFDGDRTSYTVPNDAGVTAARPSPDIVRRMQSASVARARFWSWPDGRHDMYVDLTGFADSYAQLRDLIEN